MHAIYTVQQQPIIDLLNENNQIIVKQRIGINVIHANVTIGFLPKLEALDAVLHIDSRNIILISLGIVDVPIPLDDIKPQTNDVSDSDLVEVTLSVNDVTTIKYYK